MAAIRAYITASYGKDIKHKLCNIQEPNEDLASINQLPYLLIRISETVSQNN